MIIRILSLIGITVHSKAGCCILFILFIYNIRVVTKTIGFFHKIYFYFTIMRKKLLRKKYSVIPELKHIGFGKIQQPAHTFVTLRF